jgi:hypothetical protein
MIYDGKQLNILDKVSFWNAAAVSIRRCGIRLETVSAHDHDDRTTFNHARTRFAFTIKFD